MDIDPSTIQEAWSRHPQAAGCPLLLHQAADLSSLLSAMARWNDVHGLTAIRPQEAVSRHLVDAMTAWPSLQRRLLGRRDPCLLDVGSGNGVPGLVWAVVLPATRVVLVERVARKAAFLRHAVARLGLQGRVGVYQESVQADGDLLKAMPPGGYAIIGSRAFAAIEDFLSLSWCHSGAATQWLYMAGRLDEIRGLKTSMYTHPTTPMRYELDAVESASDDGHPGGRHLVWIRRAQG